jgi:hypothetical protein
VEQELNTSITDDLNLPIPDQKWIGAIITKLQQRIMDGQGPRALRDPRFKNILFPLSTLEFWRKDSYALSKKHKYIESLNWIRTHANTLSKLVADTQEAFDMAGWDASVHASSSADVPMINLFHLLADDFPG